MAVTLDASELRERIGIPITDTARIDGLLAVVTARVERYAPGAPAEVTNEAAILYAAWLWQSGAQARTLLPADGEGRPVNASRAFLLSGAHGLLSAWRVPRAGASKA